MFHIYTSIQESEFGRTIDVVVLSLYLHGTVGFFPRCDQDVLNMTLDQVAGSICVAWKLSVALQYLTICERHLERNSRLKRWKTETFH